jgi:8-oxo-dGTP diphosphatase
MKKKLKVVAAIIENDEKEILCALRSPVMSNPDMWEFPGGKVESGEEINTALKREIEEELNCKIATTDGIFNVHTHEYESVIINLITIKCKVIEGTPIPIEHSKLIWLKREKLASLNWAPADIPAVELLIKEK